MAGLDLRLRGLLAPRRLLFIGLAMTATAVVAAAGVIWKIREDAAAATEARRTAPTPPTTERSTADPNGPIHLDGTRQKAVGVETARVEAGRAFQLVSAPGRVAVNESHYAFVTPRAPGVVREVKARIGQRVKAGDLLATVDSHEVAQARLDLIGRSQELEVARTRADWQAAISRTTGELIQRLAAGASPEEIQKRFKDRAVGQDRERLLSA
jgi:cobalt-zinc-cadmium efflux system membrane fusion protein